MVQKQKQVGQLLEEGQLLLEGQLLEQLEQQVRAQSFHFLWTLTPWHSVPVSHQILRGLGLGIWQILLERNKQVKNFVMKSLCYVCYCVLRIIHFIGLKLLAYHDNIFK